VSDSFDVRQVLLGCLRRGRFTVAQVTKLYAQGLLPGFIWELLPRAKDYVKPRRRRRRRHRQEQRQP
jgi:hypothetical protein